MVAEHSIPETGSSQDVDYEALTQARKKAHIRKVTTERLRKEEARQRGEEASRREQDARLQRESDEMHTLETQLRQQRLREEEQNILSCPSPRADEDTEDEMLRLESESDNARSNTLRSFLEQHRKPTQTSEERAKEEETLGVDEGWARSKAERKADLKANLVRRERHKEKEMGEEEGEPRALGHMDIFGIGI